MLETVVAEGASVRRPVAGAVGAASARGSVLVVEDDRVTRLMVE
jgi:hypothetical protein